MQKGWQREGLLKVSSRFFLSIETLSVEKEKYVSLE